MFCVVTIPFFVHLYTMHECAKSRLEKAEKHYLPVRGLANVLKKSLFKMILWIDLQLVICWCASLWRCPSANSSGVTETGRERERESGKERERERHRLTFNVIYRSPSQLINYASLPSGIFLPLESLLFSVLEYFLEFDCFFGKSTNNYDVIWMTVMTGRKYEGISNIRPSELVEEW